mmetsp:Transcript_32910/g.57546  ORF Transcript_32910/g.57546 Transcript_32910/m.57546 type:complete len:1174 (+) Transcript_32910:701-4222(+)
MYYEVLSCLILCTSAMLPYRLPLTNSPPLPRQFTRSCYDSVEKRFWVFGGFPEGGTFYEDLWSFDLNSNTWHEVVKTTKVYPDERKSHGCFIDEAARLLYIFGGESNLGILNDMWTFSFATSTWELVKQFGDVPPGINSFSFVSFVDVDGKQKFGIVRGAGLHGPNDYVYLLDVASLTWTRLKNKGENPKGWVEGSMVFYENALYYFGGSKTEDNTNPELADNNLYKYDLIKQEWAVVPTLNTALNRNGFALAQYGGVLYIFQGYNDLDGNLRDVVKLDLNNPNKSWEQVELAEPDVDANYLPFDSYGYTLVGTRIYFVCGWGYDALKNDITYVDLSAKGPMQFIIVADYFFAPISRKHHSLLPVGTNLLMFGGEAIYSKLGDFWAFDTEEEVWTVKMMTGDPPAPRSGYSACSVGDLLYLYGGEGELYLYQDFYVFDSTNDRWRLITDVVWPPARKHACMVCNFPKFYVLGGITINGYVSELWEVDLLSMTVKLLSKDPDDGPAAFAFSACFGEYIDSNYYINLAFGESYGEWPLGDVYRYDIQEDTWELVASVREMSRASVIKIEERLILAGGENWGLYSFNETYEISISDSSEVLLGQLTHKPYSAAFTYFKSAVYIHGGGDTFGSKYRFFVPISYFVKAEMNEGCDNCDWACSPGTFLSESGECEACPEGSYADEFGLAECKLCAAGTASRTKGNSNKNQCKTCPEDTYSADDGSSLCYSCPYGYKCPVGTSEPITAGRIDSTLSSQQPDIYTAGSSDMSIITDNLQLGVILLSCLALGLYKIKSEKVQETYEKVDIFTKAHNHFIGEVMYLRKKPYGGLFTLLFIFVAGMFLTASLVTFVLDNIEETKALVPLVALEKSYATFKTDLNVTINFENFHGPCTEDEECSDNIQVTIGHLLGEPELSCLQVYRACMVMMICSQCQVQTGAYVSYFISDIESFASAIAANVTCSSSIPGEISSIQQSVKAKSNYVIRGKAATQIYFEMTPSIFVSESDNWPSSTTGYHVAATKSPELGTEVVISELASSVGLKLDVHLEKSSSGLMTKRVMRNTLLNMLSSVLGSVFGLMSVFEREKQFEKVKRKRVEVAEKAKSLVLIKRYLNQNSVLDGKNPLKSVHHINKEIMKQMSYRSETDNLLSSSTVKPDVFNYYSIGCKNSLTKIAFQDESYDL